MNRSVRRARIAVAVVAVGAIAGYAVYRAVRGAAVRRQPVIASGTVEMTEVAVSAKVGGRVAVLLVDEGDLVRRGQLVARLETRELDARVAEAEAAAAGAQARLDDLERGARPEELEQARAAVMRAEAAYAGALAAARTAGEGFATVTDLKQQVDAAEAALRAAQAQRDQAAARLDLLKAGARPEELEQARAALAAARARLALVREGPRAEEIEEGRAAVASAQAALRNAEATWQRARKLVQEGAMARQDLDDAAAARDRAQAALDAAQARLRALQTGSRPEEREQAEAEARRLEAQVRLLEAGARSEEIRQATAELQRAAANLQGAERALSNARRAYLDRLGARGQRESAETQVAVARQQVEEARARLALLGAGATPDAIRAARAARDQARALLAQARSRRADAEIRAPMDGVVAEQVVEAGEVVGAGQSLLTLTNLDDAWVKVYLPVALLGRVRIGTPATVRVDAFPGREFRGRVVEISQVPEFTPKNVQTQEQRTQLVFWVKVAVPNKDRSLKAGLPADAVFAPEVCDGE